MMTTHLPRSGGPFWSICPLFLDPPSRMNRKSDPPRADETNPEIQMIQATKRGRPNACFVGLDFSEFSFWILSLFAFEFVSYFGSAPPQADLRFRASDFLIRRRLACGGADSPLSVHNLTSLHHHSILNNVDNTSPHHGCEDDMSQGGQHDDLLRSAVPTNHA